MSRSPRSLALAAASLLLTASGTSRAEEWRRDGVAQCPPQNPQGEVSIVRQAPMAGDAKHWLAVDPAFARKHAAETKGEGAWLSGFDGAKSGPLRVYRSRSGHSVFVIALCPAGKCGDQRAYVAFETGTGAYGATVMEGAHLREVIPGNHNTTLAMHAPQIGDALQCAIQADS